MIIFSYLITTYIFQSALASHNKTRKVTDVLVDWEFDKFAPHIAIMVFLLSVITLRIGYQRLQAITSSIPESFLLLVAGCLFGVIIRYSSAMDASVWSLTPELFLTYLLPPIVLDAAYEMYNRAMLDHFGAIILFAVVGTVMNFLLIGPLMYYIYKWGGFGAGWYLNLDMKSFLLFSSFIIAVDPVAVLAIFQDTGVDQGLYYMVFGESLFNDAITVVLYKLMSSFGTLKVIKPEYVVLAILSFFTVSLGGILVGIVVGILTCLITRCTSSLAPGIVLILGYFSYIFGDCLGWSGIISMICCGLIQTAYSFHNLSRVSVMIVRRVTKMIAEISEAVIFLFIGIEAVAHDMNWHIPFCLWGLVTCLIIRAVVVFFLANCYNRWSVQMTKITKVEQVMLIQGGLRGAVCFCLAVLVDPHFFEQDGEEKRKLFITASLFIIFFTIICLGMSVKPLVNWLKVPMRKKETFSLFKQLNNHLLGEALLAIEGITGKKGVNAARDWLYEIDDRYIRKFLQRDPETHDQKIIKLYEKIALKLHYATMLRPCYERSASGGEEHEAGRVDQSSSELERQKRAVHGQPIAEESIDEFFDEESASAKQKITTSPFLTSCWNKCCRRALTERRATIGSMESGRTIVSRKSDPIKDGAILQRNLRSSRYVNLGAGYLYQGGKEFADNYRDLLVSKSVIVTNQDQPDRRRSSWVRPDRYSMMEALDRRTSAQFSKSIKSIHGYRNSNPSISDNQVFLSTDMGSVSVPPEHRVAPSLNSVSLSDFILIQEEFPDLGSVQQRRASRNTRHLAALNHSIHIAKRRKKSRFSSTNQ